MISPDFEGTPVAWRASENAPLRQLTMAKGYSCLGRNRGLLDEGWGDAQMGTLFRDYGLNGNFRAEIGRRRFPGFQGNLWASFLDLENARCCGLLKEYLFHQDIYIKCGLMIFNKKKFC